MLQLKAQKSVSGLVSSPPPFARPPTVNPRSCASPCKCLPPSCQFTSCPSSLPPLQVDTQGNLFNIYMEDNQRRITPVGNISDMQRFKVGGGSQQH